MGEEALDRASELPLYIGVSLVSEDEIKNINRDFRGIDKVTDVLSFPQFESTDEILAEIEGDEALVDIPLGDVVICLDQSMIDIEEKKTVRIVTGSLYFLSQVRAYLMERKN